MIPASSTSVAITVMLPPCSSGTSWPIRARSKRSTTIFNRWVRHLEARRVAAEHRCDTAAPSIKNEAQARSADAFLKINGNSGLKAAWASCEQRRVHSAAYWLLLRKLEREVSRTVEHSGLVELSIYEGFSASRRRRSSACSSIHSVELVGSRTVKQLIERS
jgi:hypothetical protein